MSILREKADLHRTLNFRQQTSLNRKSRRDTDRRLMEQIANKCYKLTRLGAIGYLPILKSRALSTGCNDHSHATVEFVLASPCD